VYKPFRKVKKAEKLLHRWQGPFNVIRQTTPVNYEVKLSSGSRKSEIMHAIKMKLFHDLVERGPNLNMEATEAMFDTPLPDVPPPPVEIHRETGPDNGTHGEEAAVLHDSNVRPVPSPGGVRKQKTVNRPVRLPTRIQPARRAGRPDRYLALLLPYTICVLAFLGPVKVDTLLVRDTVIFNEKRGVAFGESFWTVITDLDIRPGEAVVQTLKVRLKEYSEMAVKCRKTGNQQRASAAKKLEVKCRWFERELNQSEHRLATFRDAIGSPSKQRRAVIDGGGSTLKWLFGVANKKINGLTRRENEIVHLMDQQATGVNESLWKIRTNTKLIQELEGQTAELTKNYNNLLGRMAERQAYMIEYFDFFINLDTAFESV
jgi:hypothetical protein